MTLPLLVVDDSPIMRAMMRKSLALSGQPADQILEASDGLEALNVLRRCEVAMVFADLHMPNMTGFELIEAMAKDPMLKALPVVVVSSDAGELHQEQLLRLGVRAILRKPFRPEQLRAVIRSLSPANTGKD